MKRLAPSLSLTLLSALLLLTSACEQTPAVDEKEAGLPYQLVVAPGRNEQVGTYFVVQGVIPEDQNVPEAARQPAQQFAAALYCGKTWAEPSIQQRQEYTRFTNTWLRTSGATQNNNHLAIEDIRISCEADSTIQFKASDFQRAQALLASGFEGNRTLTRGRDDAADHFQFFSGGDPLSIQVTPQEIRAVPAEGDAAMPGSAVVRQGGNADTLSGGGAFEYDPAQPVEVVVQRQGQPFWDVLSVQYNDGQFGWRQTATNPLEAAN